MNYNQLEELALKAWRRGNGAYLRKALCQGCVLIKASITAPEDALAFEQVWEHWAKMLKRDRCVVCGEMKETMMWPAN